MAKGADWGKQLANEKQTQLPNGEENWSRCKISQPWQDWDMIKIRVDTDTNTVVFQRGYNTLKKTFRNILTFTSSPKYPDSLRAFAYCCGNVGKLTIHNSQ